MVKNPVAKAGDSGLIPGLRRCPREGNGNPLQYSCLGGPMDRGTCWAIVRGVPVRGVPKASDMTLGLNNNSIPGTGNKAEKTDKVLILFKFAFW